MMKVLITGGAKGIGASLTKALVNEGHTVYVNYLTSEAKALELSKISDQVILKQGDITKEEFIDELFKEQYDVVINNASYYNDDLVINKTKEDFIKVLEVNVVAPFLIMKKYASCVDKGLVINMCSTDGVDTYNEYNYDYASSKAALLNLTKSMSIALTNLKIYGLVLNYVKTEAVLEMDPLFLQEELDRIGQRELIETSTVNAKVLKLIKGNYVSGYVERVDSND